MPAGYVDSYTCPFMTRSDLNSNLFMGKISTNQTIRGHLNSSSVKASCTWIDHFCTVQVTLVLWSPLLECVAY